MGRGANQCMVGKPGPAARECVLIGVAGVPQLHDVVACFNKQLCTAQIYSEVARNGWLVTCGLGPMEAGGVCACLVGQLLCASLLHL